MTEEDAESECRRSGWGCGGGGRGEWGRGKTVMDPQSGSGWDCEQQAEGGTRSREDHLLSCSPLPAPLPLPLPAPPCPEPADSLPLCTGPRFADEDDAMKAVETLAEVWPADTLP